MGPKTVNSVPRSKTELRWSVVSPRMVLAAACILFFIQQLPYFQTRWIEDENSYADAAWTFAREGKIRMSMYPPTDVGSVVDVRPPAMPVAVGAVFKIIGLGVWQARLLPFLGALAAIFVTYLLGGYLAGEWAGAIAALLVATDSLLFVAGRTTRPEGMEACLNMLAALLFMRAMRRDSWGLALLSGLVAGISMNFHINGIITPVAMGLWALYEYGWKVWQKPVAWVFAATVALCIVPYVLWINSDALHQHAYVEMQNLGTVMPFSRLHGEIMRYSDFLGIGNLKALPVAIPVRAPITMLILGSLGVLYVCNRRLFWYLGLFLAAHMGVWFYLANKNVRYTAVAAPLFAIIVAAGCISLATTPNLRRIAVACCVVYGVIGMLGNAFLVNRFKNADYVGLTAQLREAVPQGSTVYGANTFWLALQEDRRYYSADRTSLDYATVNLKPQYLILYDRLMMHGSGYGDNFGDLRSEATAYVKTHGEKVALIPSAFYGDLEIYRVNSTTGNSSLPK